mmetsp:Transcript_2470/g.2512  ORF Transcript_2470/g.2512 Transcript_2470/m.2512 type:complete len:191 (-) Transcript_2470:250-822(-)
MENRQRYTKMDISSDDNTLLFSNGEMCRVRTEKSNSSHIEGASYSDDPKVTKPKMKKRKMHVSFGDIEVREYDQTLVDHPGTTYGPSIGLSWDHSSAKILDLEAHECYRILHSPRRVGKALVMTYVTRRNILQHELHFSKEEIEKASSEAALIQKQRLISYARIPLESVDEVMESLKREVTQIVGRKHSQ